MSKPPILVAQRSIPPVFAAGCLLLAGAVADGASAQGRVEAQYEVTLAGIPIGKGSWVVDIAEEQYSAIANGKTTGLVAMISTGEGNGGAQGRVIKGQLAPANYTVKMITNKKTEVLRISLAQGNVKDFAIEPEQPVNPERIPVTEAHRRGVLDPMTGSLLRVPGTGDPVSPEACGQVQSVFDGRMRYDLKLEYRRVEAVKVDKGYQGPAVVCAIQFVPISGYVPDRTAIKYLKAQRNMEVWFAPILGTRVLMPLKVVIPTPIGTGVMQATRFTNSLSAHPSNPAAAVRTQ
ncbi:DUF3108 domain-containing protein [Bradyrhizobium sp. LHD-71]|uniref:DUF3108 domain-containing protein n=1 Tax=Bradyrhizobium sp. LHD-71 TaxID=3072141 RepID=UPI0028109B5E|nr:DUF3108 domain-containing protein [Bradyrhizobium sp. LHD-71]MDQ8732811.1 DUF3108 domain-containing protein [Bradyrhizobium sp. LHD-71]